MRTKNMTKEQRIRQGHCMLVQLCRCDHGYDLLAWHNELCETKAGGYSWGKRRGIPKLIQNALDDPKWVRTVAEVERVGNSIPSPGDHPLETCARFSKMNAIDFHLERLDTFLRWNREHFATFEKCRESDPDNAERELEFLKDTVEQGYEHLARLTELLRAGYQPTLDDH